jgi:AcrR family transcriptional regulator
VVTARPMRRQPEQARSRERVDTILAAAAELIGEYGIEPITITDIATRAGMGVTALYRYYPNKKSILRDLSLEVLEVNRQLLIAPAVESDQALEPLLRESLTAYWHMHRDEPFRLRLRVAIHADAELSALDLADSRHNAQVFAARLTQLGTTVDPSVLERRVLMLISLLDSLMLTAILMEPPEADLLIDDFATMALDLVT